VPPGFERILDDRYCLFFGPNRTFTSVFAFRIPDVDAAVEEVRTAARARAVPSVSWWVGPDTDPSDLAERLLDRGLVHEQDPRVAAMVLLEEPPAAAGGARARRAASLEELRVATEVSLDAFESSEEEREAFRDDVEDRWEREGFHTATFVAFVDGELVGAARSAYLEGGAVLLIGGAVLPHARGRGAYRALVRARWEDAVQRASPALIVHAGSMSRPILDRLGFETLCELEVLEDRIS
jgi:GNAT superfamily N-acetyltransferase